MDIFAFCVINFEPIRIQTCSAPQNDGLNLSFVKDINTVDKKMAGSDRKIGHLSLCFVSKQSII